jgi:hypothetical protein
MNLKEYVLYRKDAAWNKIPALHKKACDAIGLREVTGDPVAIPQKGCKFNPFRKQIWSVVSWWEDGEGNLVCRSKEEQLVESIP